MRVWTEEEIRSLIASNDEVLYRALKRIYSKQTDDEKITGQTVTTNGVGFNGVDSPFMSSICEYLLKYGYLSEKQRVFARKKLVKYNRQLTKIANEVEVQKYQYV